MIHEPIPGRCNAAYTFSRPGFSPSTVFCEKYPGHAYCHWFNRITWEEGEQ